MKQLRILFANVALTLLLSISTYAGVMETTVTATQQAAPATSSTAQADISVSTGDPSGNSIIVTAMTLLQRVMTLF